MPCTADNEKCSLKEGRFWAFLRKNFLPLCTFLLQSMRKLEIVKCWSPVQEIGLQRYQKMICCRVSLVFLHFCGKLPKQNVVSHVFHKWFCSVRVLILRIWIAMERKNESILILEHILWESWSVTKRIQHIRQISNCNLFFVLYSFCGCEHFHFRQYLHTNNLVDIFKLHILCPQNGASCKQIIKHVKALNARKNRRTEAWDI